MRKHDETLSDSNETPNKQEAIQQQIDEIMDSFDFAKVRKVMKFLNWEWASCMCVPDEADLRAQARNLLKDATRMNSTLMTGGFCAKCISGEEDGVPFLRLDLSFNLDHSLNDGISYNN